MSLRGRAFLPMWFELGEGNEQEFYRWHTVEHMPERLGIPGFLRGRRYVRAHGPDHVGFQLYEGRHIETFRSPGYLARLNAPTDWSKQVQPNLLKFTRGACQTLISYGEGAGGVLITVRMAISNGDPLEASQSLIAAVPAIARLPGITGVHVGQHMPHITNLETAETRLRPSAIVTEFDFVLLIEGTRVSDLEDSIPELPGIVQLQSELLETDVYHLVYLLDEEC